VINDRVDLAAAVGADAVQLGQRSLPVHEVRRLESRGLLGTATPPLRIGASVHSRDEARDARGADWLLVGTLYPTPSHRKRPGSGPQLVADVVRDSGVPVLGIGGVSVERVTDVIAQGAHGVAVLGGVWYAEHGPPDRAALRYVEALASAGAPGSRKENEPS
jgi:thiamine-phosphate diphosphorylase